MSRINLDSVAVLATLHIGMWSARKFDRKASDEHNKNAGAAADASRVNKKLVPDNFKSYKDLTSYLGSVRQRHYAQTLPWEEGRQLLPHTNDSRYRGMIEEARQKVRNELVPAFLNDYPEIMANARFHQGKMYNEDDFPKPEHISAKFYIDVIYDTVPRGDFRCTALSSGLQAEMERNYMEREQRAIAAALTESWDRLFEPVRVIADVLSDPEARVYDSFFNNIRSVCDVLARLNVLNDPRLERMRADVMEKLGSYEADRVRKSQRVRTQVATTAGQLMAQIRGARRISLPDAA